MSAEGFEQWLVDIKVLDTNPIYQNKTFRLKFAFSSKYPIGEFSFRLESTDTWALISSPPPCRDRLHPIRCPFAQIYHEAFADTSLEPPEVTFILAPDRSIPMHPHIYSNGIICLDLLGQQGWSPVQNVESICMSLQSMLTSNNLDERPEGDAQFVATNRRRPRDIDFYYHDNTV